MKKLGAQMVFATFLVMLSTAALTVTVMLLLEFLATVSRRSFTIRLRLSSAAMRSIISSSSTGFTM